MAQDNQEPDRSHEIVELNSGSPPLLTLWQYENGDWDVVQKEHIFRLPAACLHKIKVDGEQT